MIILGIEVLCVFILAMILSTVILDEKKRRKQNMRPVKLEGYWRKDERRSAERLDASLEVKYFINGKSADVKSVDISAKGIKLTLDEKIEKGVLLRLEIKIPDSGHVVRANGEVAWSREAVEDETASGGKRFFNTGIKFIKVNKTDEKKLFDFIYTLTPQKP